MSPDLDELLCQRYPAIFIDRNNPDSCMYRGFECGDGWFNLIDRLCFRIQADVDRDGRPQPVAAQVKEKLGGLRIYWREVDEWVRALADFACDLSHVMCEVCGAPAEAVQSPRRVRRVRCRTHWEQASASAGQREVSVVMQPEVPDCQTVDECFERAVELVVRSQTASVSQLQRHMKQGHARAVRLMAALETAGVVSPPSTDGIRQVMRPNVPEAGQPREGV